MFNANSSDHARPRHSENTRMRMKCQVINTLGLYSEWWLRLFKTHFEITSDLEAIRVGAGARANGQLLDADIQSEFSADR
ncbi:hypothetical protein INT44_007842 [Umbelopsis vinacea]|uniref:Uncharacterized protein n=1 Tax=Umbelopsis vinacea TaxID=44442 RepID=A0A8H7PKX3_9FUNG|nr:hypothetical protein INT44_007842 [Umbelopsis vinacea]